MAEGQGFSGKMKNVSFHFACRMNIDVEFETDTVTLTVPDGMPESEILEWLKENDPIATEKIDEAFSIAVEEVNKKLEDSGVIYTNEGGDKEEHFYEVIEE